MDQPIEALETARTTIDRASDLLACKGWMEYIVPWLQASIAELEISILSGELVSFDVYKKCCAVRQNRLAIIAKPMENIAEARKLLDKANTENNSEPNPRSNF